MIFSCEKETLKNSISIVSKALPARSVNPITDGILFTAGDGAVTLTATDSSLTIRTKMAADVEEMGSVVINGRFFFEIIGKMPDGEIKVNGDFHKGIEVKGNASKMNITAMDPDEYPVLPVIDRDVFFTLPQSSMKKIINQTQFATAQDEARPILTGCLFELEGQALNVVALDGYRLALRSLYIEDAEKPVKAILPARALKEMPKILGDTDDPVRIYIQKSYCMVEMEETRIITRLIEGEFIKYRPIIPTNLENNITVDRLELLESIDRAQLIVRETMRNNYVVFRFQDGKLIITSRSDTGNAYEEVAYSGSAHAMEIGFNPRYFIECLKSIDEEFITFSFSTPSSPTVITPVDGTDYLYLILPVRL